MQIYLSQVLDAHQLDAVLASLKDDTLFEDGTRTAGRMARKVKSNLQARATSVTVKGAAALVEKCLREHTVFRSAALPSAFSKIMFNRYDEGMAYGTHVDDAYIAGCRTDLSFTLFLSDPESYDGGHLVLERSDGDEPVKLAAGDAILYPSTMLHHIEEVTRGQRLAAVGWVQSRVRLAEHRSVLFDLQHALNMLPETEESHAARLTLMKARSNLLRLWAD